MELREVTMLAVVLRLSAALVIGGLIGLERGLKNRPAGLRTYMLVCVGACLIMLTNQYLWQVSNAGDPMRLGAQVVSGIGFLGAGTIVVTHRSQIKGLTTAAGLWAAAGVGLALGVGFYEAAIFGGLTVFAVLTIMQLMDNRMHRNTKRLEIYIELDPKTSLGDLLHFARELEYEITDVQREGGVEETGNRGYTATVRAKTRRNHVEILEDIRGLKGVTCLEEL